MGAILIVIGLAILLYNFRGLEFDRDPFPKSFWKEKATSFSQELSDNRIELLELRILIESFCIADPIWNALPDFAKGHINFTLHNISTKSLSGDLSMNLTRPTTFPWKKEWQNEIPKDTKVV